MTKPDDDFLKTLQKGVQSVLDNAEATPAEKLQAVVAGTKILQTKHKIKDTGDEDDGQHFFRKKRGR